MDILHINFSDDRGGAAQAVLRFHKLLLRNKIQSSMLVNEKKTNHDYIIGPNKTWEIFKINLKETVSRNLKYIFKTENKNTHSINLIPSGLHKKINNINPEWVNLHWIGNEMISIKEISKINSKIVWTLHDMWPFCGAEHFTDDKRFILGYNNMNRPTYESKFDLNKYVWIKKTKYFHKINKIICTTNWMYERAKNSILFKNKDIELISLTLDKKFWQPQDKEFSKKILQLDNKKKVICFGAEDFYNNKRKGFDLFINAIKSLSTNIEFQILIFGDDKKYKLEKKNIKITNLGKLKDEHTLKTVFSASDFVVMPSRMESFGQIVLEALHCGTPCVVFKNTAMEDLINHKNNGYVCESITFQDLMLGIEWCLKNDLKKDCKKISDDAILKYDYNGIIDRYINFLKK